MNKLFALVLVLVSINTFAQDDTPDISYSMPALEAGFKWNTADVTTASSNKQVMGFQVGGSTVFNLNSLFGIKTGLFYSERPFKAETPGGETTGKITYFEVPAFFMVKLEEYAGVYAGPSLAVKMGDEYKNPAGSSISGVKTMIMPITFGAQFKFTSMLGLNIFFETTSGDIATGISNSRAVGANLLIAFD